jgi:hypothetical protein
MNLDASKTEMRRTSASLSIKKNPAIMELVKYLAMSEYKYKEDTDKLQKALVK